jgi:hypothetical protein
MTWKIWHKHIFFKGIQGNNNNKSFYLYTVMFKARSLWGYVFTPYYIQYLQHTTLHVDFLRREENWRTRRKTLMARERTTHQTNSTHICPKPELTPDHSGERRALTYYATLSSVFNCCNVRLHVYRVEWVCIVMTHRMVTAWHNLMTSTY